MGNLMDDSWREVYERNACEDLPIHAVSCWSEDGFRELLSLTLKIVKGLEGVKSVVDVGCGPGVYCGELSGLGFSVLGIDYSSSVISKAKKLFPHIDFLVGSAYDLPVVDEFDLVLCVGVLQCVFEPERVLEELVRVSRKYVLISTLLRNYRVENPLRLVEKKLEFDSWPTRDYHPSELEDFFVARGFSCKVILKNNGSLIKDGFFLLASKND